MKTSTEIEDWVYSLLITSKVKSLINGGIYRNGTRPIDSMREDAVITVVDGLDGMYSSGVVHVNIFIPFISDRQGQLIKDIDRCRLVERGLLDFRLNIPINEFWVNSNSQEQVKTYNLDDQKVSYVHCKIKYRLVTV